MAVAELILLPCQLLLSNILSRRIGKGVGGTLLPLAMHLVYARLQSGQFLAQDVQHTHSCAID